VVRARITVTGVLFDREVGGATDRYVRLFSVANVERPIGASRAVLRATFGASRADSLLPIQALHFAGGPVSAPGYDFHQFAGEAVGTLHAEWRRPVSFVSFRLGRYGRTPASATLAPFAHAVYVAGSALSVEQREGWYPSAGLGTQLLFDLIRFDVARGLRDGRWTFSVDVGRDFWSVL